MKSVVDKGTGLLLVGRQMIWQLKRTLNRIAWICNPAKLSNADSATNQTWCCLFLVGL